MKDVRHQDLRAERIRIERNCSILSSRLTTTDVRWNYQVRVCVPSLNKAAPVNSGLPT